MGAKNKQIDAYIAKSADFAKPILIHFRELVHKACPDVQEKMKWSFPHFDYKDEMMCSMAAFKQHAAIGFWKATLITDSNKILKKTEKNAMGHFGAIRSLSDLPADKIIVSLIKEAMKLNDDGIKVPKAKPVEKKNIKTPAYFKSALNKNKTAAKIFEGFSPSHKREYIQWITEAKTEDTRNRRVAKAIEWMSEGKPRNWKYVKK